MHINQIFSHLNGEEYLLVHKVALYKQVKEMVAKTHIKKLSDKLKTRGWTEYCGYEQQSYFVKERIAIEVHTEGSVSNTQVLYDKHLALYVGDQIDVGIEILPMKAMQAQMSSGVAYYEGELYNVVRDGRGVPAVPLVILGIDA